MTLSSNDSDNINHVSIDNVDTFVQQNNPDFVQGYFMALNDILNESRDITFKKLDDTGGVPNPAGTVRRKMLKFYFSTEHLINRFIQLGVKPSGPND